MAKGFLSLRAFYGQWLSIAKGFYAKVLFIANGCLSLTAFYS